MNTKKAPPLKTKKPVAKSEYTGFVPAVAQASQILLTLAKNPSPKVNLTDICKSVNIYKSKGYAILNTLQKYGFVQKDSEGKTYSLGLGLISLSRKVLDNVNYNEIATPVLETVARKTRSTALFGIIDNTNIFIVARQETDQDISVTIRPGYRFHITHGAHGKAIAAFLSKDEREKTLKQKKLFFYGDVSKFDRERLETELAQCRETGFAFDMGELNAGINVIASPVFDSHGRLIGSIFIMGTFQQSLIDKYGPIVAENARQFSSLLGADVKEIYGK